MALRFHAVATTDVGRVRSRNEDAYALDLPRGLVLVADGMGGHPAGHIASALAVEEALRVLRADGPPDPPRSVEDQSEGQDPGAGMRRAVRRANQRLFEDAGAHPERRGMGTTLTALRIVDAQGSFVIGHVGDSRAYLWSERELRPLTRDHTWVQEQVDLGRLTRDEARRHPMGNVLNRALGIDPEVDPEIVRGRAFPGELLLLCTDGLLAMLDDGDIAEILRERGDWSLDDTARRLVEETNERGAIDNVTVALVDFRRG